MSVNQLCGFIWLACAFIWFVGPTPYLGFMYIGIAFMYFMMDDDDDEDE